MEEKQLYDFERESGNRIVLIRNHFRNMSEVKELMNFPFEKFEIGDPYKKDVYDIYKDSETNSYVWAIGGDAHCYGEGKLRKYEEGIVLFCEPSKKEKLIKKIV